MTRLLRRAVRTVWRFTVWVGRLLIVLGIVAGLGYVDGLILADVDWSQVPAQPVTAQTVVLAATGVGWVLLLVVVGVAVASADRRRASRPPRRRLPVPLYRTVSAVTGVIVLLANAVTARPAPAPPPSPDPTAGTTTPVTGPLPQNRPTIPAATGTAEATGAADQHSWGWLPWPAVGAALATIALISADRRRHYQPQPVTVRPRITVNPAAVLPGLTPDPDDTRGTDLPARDAPVVGVTGDGWLTLAQLPRPVTLAGPGATDAIRSILAVAATHHALHRQTTPTILITAADTRTLLGDHPTLTTDLAALPGIRIAPDIDTLLDHLDRDTTPGAAIQSLLLHLPPLSTRAAGRLHAVLTGHHGATAVLSHPTPTSTPWRVTTDGRLDPPPDPTADGVTPQRLTVLTATAALALVTNVARATHPGATTASADLPDAATPAHDTGSPLSPAAAAAAESRPPADDDRPRRLHLQVLGTPTVTIPHDDGTSTPVHLTRRLGLLLLTYLVVHPDGATADDLKEALWPDVPSRSARNRFNTTVSVLGSTLHQAAGTPVLQHHPDPTDRTTIRYRLDPDHLTVDLWQLHHLLDLAATQPDHRRELLDRAADHVTGTFAAGLSADWLPAYRDAVTDQLTDLFHTLATDEPDHHTAVALLQRAIRLVAPTTEHLYHDLMRRHAALGNTTDVHRTYHALTDRLAALHTIPDPATRHLYENLTDTTPAHESPRTGRRTR